MIRCDHPEVINALIDQCKIEKRVLVRTMDEAEELMFHSNSLPKGFEVYTESGERFFIS